MEAGGNPDEEPVTPVSRIDSGHMTSAFDSCDADSDNFLLHSDKLTVDDVNRLTSMISSFLDWYNCLLFSIQKPSLLEFLCASCSFSLELVP